MAWQMNGDEHASRKVNRKPFGEGYERLNPSGGGADGENVAIVDSGSPSAVAKGTSGA
jgi:hypothetical protein